MDKVVFFQDDQNELIIRQFYKEISQYPELPDPYPKVVGLLKGFFGILEHNLDYFDVHCEANIHWIGKSFLIHLENFLGENKNDLLMDIFTDIYRFVCEIDFYAKGATPFGFNSIKKFVETDLDKFESGQKRDLLYASYFMPISLMKRLLHSEGMTEFKNVNEALRKAVELKESWSKDFDEKVRCIDSLNENLSKMETGFNFVGLVKGFENLYKKKTLDKYLSLSLLFILGALMVLPVAAHLNSLFGSVDEIERYREVMLYAVPSLVTLELIFIYFFRVVLLNYRGIQAQLLQLDLRVALCQFIQSYADYSKKIKKEDASALEKFESVIFSAITTDPEKMPTTFDGIEQLSKFFQGLRGK